MRALLVLLCAAVAWCGDAYPTDREETLTLVDGRAMVGVYLDADEVLLIRAPSGRVGRVVVARATIASRHSTAAAEAAIAAAREAAREAERRREAAALAERQMAREQLAARLQAENDERRNREAQQQRAVDVAAMYAEKGYRFSPVTMTADEMHAAYERGEEQKRAAAEAAQRAELQRLRAVQLAEDVRRREAQERSDAEMRERQRQLAAAEKEGRRATAAAEQARADRAAAEIERGQNITAILTFAAVGVGLLLTALPIVVAFTRRHPHRAPLTIVLACCFLATLGAAIFDAQTKRPAWLWPTLFTVAWIGCLAWASWPLRHDADVQPPPAT